MIVWLVLFLVITIVAFILAMRSMRNYHEQTEHFQFRYSQFLIQEPSALTEQCLKDIYQALLPKRALISLERLSKGSRQALVLYGPAELLQPFFTPLKLMELEDYIQELDPSSVTAWQLTGHPTKPLHIDTADLSEGEQQWLQITIQPVKPGLEMTVNKAIKHLGNRTYKLAASRQKSFPDQALFATVMKLVLVGPDAKKREMRSHHLAHQLSAEGLVKLPQKFTSVELLKQYQKRSLAIADSGSVILSAAQIEQLLAV